MAMSEVFRFKEGIPQIKMHRPALWILLERYGMREKCLHTIWNLLESTEYKVRGREGLSEG